MNRPILCALLLVLAGCSRPVVGPEESTIRPGNSVQIVIYEAFPDEAALVSSPQTLRIGRYFDLEPYDSVRITFQAIRLSSGPGPDRITVRIGPSCYLTASVVAGVENVSITARPAAISKRQFAALTLFTPDAGVSMEITHLRVIGWTEAAAGQ